MFSVESQTQKDKHHTFSGSYVQIFRSEYMTWCNYKNQESKKIDHGERGLENAIARYK